MKDVQSGCVDLKAVLNAHGRSDMHLWIIETNTYTDAHSSSS